MTQVQPAAGFSSVIGSWKPPSQSSPEASPATRLLTKFLLFLACDRCEVKARKLVRQIGVGGVPRLRPKLDDDVLVAVRVPDAVADDDRRRNTGDVRLFLAHGLRRALFVGLPEVIEAYLDLREVSGTPQLSIRANPRAATAPAGATRASSATGTAAATRASSATGTAAATRASSATGTAAATRAGFEEDVVVKYT